MAHIPSDACPMLSGRAWTITADIDVPTGVLEGVIYARGGHNIGHSMFVRNGELHFYYKIGRAHV